MVDRERQSYDVTISHKNVQYLDNDSSIRVISHILNGHLLSMDIYMSKLLPMFTVRSLNPSVVTNAGSQVRADCVLV